MPPRALNSPLSIVILGLLAESPQHPYAMRTLMRERGHDRIVRSGASSLYDAVGRLERAGLIGVEGSGREGNRPERTVYALTGEGAAALRAWLRDALAEPERSERFVAALSFMYALGRDAAVQALSERAAGLQAQVEAVEAGLARAERDGVPAIFLSEERYSQALRRAELAWLEDFIARLRSGELRWPQPHTDQ